MNLLSSTIPCNPLSTLQYTPPHRLFQPLPSPVATLRTNNGNKRAARQLLDRMRDTVPSWPSSSATFKRTPNQAEFIEDFEVFLEMLSSGLRPDEFLLRSLLLKAGSGPHDVGVGMQLHSWIIRTGLTCEHRISASILTMYSSYGLLEDAYRVFDGATPDILIWNSIISAHVVSGQYGECILLFLDMLWIGQFKPTDHTYVSLLKVCSFAGEIGYGQAIHGMILKDAVTDKTRMLNCLIAMYAKCKDLRSARNIFETLEEKDIVSWNAIIAGHQQNREFEYAVHLFRGLVGSELQLQPVLMKPNRITFLTLLSALSTLSALKLGRELHAQIIRSGIESCNSIGNSLINMYGKCNEIVTARAVFDNLQEKDAITWNSMLTGYAQNLDLAEFYELFKLMQASGYEPDNYSLTILLSTLSSEPMPFERQIWGKEIHCYVLRRTLPTGMHISTYNAILTMYAKNKKIGSAEKIFEGMLEKDLYSWNAMMDAYSLNEQYHEALLLFITMLEHSIQPDHLTLSILLTASGRLLSIRLGMQLHSFSIKIQAHHSNFQDSVLAINNALVSMYSKCGSINDSIRVFALMDWRDIFSWTAMITGYAHHGMAYEAVEVFEEMKRDGMKPNSVTFLGLLTACAHAGLIEEGSHYFSSMSTNDSTEPGIEHYACMVDLFSRCCKFEEALSFIDRAISTLCPHQNDSVCLWKVLLGACHAHKQLELGIHAATRIFEFEAEDETTHILLSNLYAAFGMWKEARGVRRLMKDKRIDKEAGRSWVEVGSMRHLFVASDSNHPCRKEIYEKLRNLNEKFKCMGYIPITELVFHDVVDSKKEAIVGSHSEKLTMSYALLKSGNTKGVI